MVVLFLLSSTAIYSLGGMQQGLHSFCQSLKSKWTGVLQEMKRRPFYYTENFIFWLLLLPPSCISLWSLSCLVQMRLEILLLSNSKYGPLLPSEKRVFHLAAFLYHYALPGNHISKCVINSSAWPVSFSEVFCKGLNPVDTEIHTFSLQLMEMKVAAQYLSELNPKSSNSTLGWKKSICEHQFALLSFSLFYTLDHHSLYGSPLHKSNNKSEASSWSF